MFLQAEDGSLSIPFRTPNEAIIAYEIIKVDKDLKGNKVKRYVTLNNTELAINFEGTDTKKLRVAVNSTFKNLLLIIKTLSEFGIG
ncbi:hypothetical protein RR48_14535 [Papilio machaon]|uniref:L antigen family member 3 n=1 Tax=Papilio machaon TaxID=76193 RepID=A0A194QKK8_PAPMA|nr:hypothetical protein RR48_14535 [Papilio machaon]